MEKSDTNEFSRLKMTQYAAKYLQTIVKMRATMDRAQQDALMQLALPWSDDGLQPPIFRQHVLTHDYKTLNAIYMYLDSFQQFPNNSCKSDDKSLFELLEV